MPTAIVNSRRRFDTATYTPIRLGDGTGPADLATLASTFRHVELAPAELDALRQHSQSAEDRHAIDAVGQLINAPTADTALAAAVGLAAVGHERLLGLLGRVRTLRTHALTAAQQALAAPPPAARTPSPRTGPAGRLDIAALGTLRLRYQPPIEATLLSGSTQPRFQVATTPGAAQFDVDAFLDVVAPYVPPGTDEATLDPLAALEEIARRQRNSAVVIDALQRRTLEPLGLLHLERLEMTPDDVERGELVYSLPLAPKEKVTLSHKEWAVRETELADYVQDFLENFSEKGVAESDEIAFASETEARRTDRTSLGAASGMTITPAVDGNSPGTSVVENTESRQESRTHAREMTQRASSRSIRDHRVSFTVKTTEGTEDFTSRLIENPEAARIMRIDYFRRMRRWQVQLRRVGVRLTYDVVIPDPGRRLRSRQDLMRRYDNALNAPFDPGVAPDDLDASTYLRYAAGYGAVLLEPPAAPVGSPPYRQWQMASYASLRDAAFARFTQVQEVIRQRRAELARQVDTAADSLALRKLEREQIMRGVLEWLIPGFGTAVANVDPLGMGDATWLQVMEYGEYIKFVHAAVDWANLHYVLYPYFWAGGTMEQLYFNHPDARHREFLRAGATRVFLPIQPGREEDWAALLEHGRFGSLPQGHRFAPILSQVRAAHAQFATLSAGNGDGAGGVTVGDWVEYTPTGALDVDVVTRAVDAE